MGRQLELHIVGEGALKETLVKEAKDLGIEAETTFHGRMAHSELGNLLRECNIYVSMPLSEGVSASLFEAMACGCFPVVCDLEANRFWVNDGENGFLIPLDDVEMLAKRIAETQNNPELYTRAREANFQLIREKATIKNNIATFISRYEELIRQSKAKKN
jgi:glycosyltransferase involved in cell wall biosynthesis